jgi:hypothetical protein
MSGLIDTIVRRRRASASSRLGPPAHLLETHPWAPESEPVNGHDPDADPAAPGATIDAPEQPTTGFDAVAEPLEYPPLRERIALRRRARYLAAVREIQLRDLGGFLLELHRFGRQRPDLVEAKLAATAATDAELRSLHHQLDEEAPIGELRRPGIGGACEHCGAVHGSLDRFCASCGEQLR